MASTASARSTGNVFVGSRAANFGTRGFDASWELDLFGSNRHNVRAAAGDMVGAEDARRGAQVSLLAELAKNYVEVLRSAADCCHPGAHFGPAGNT